MALGDTVLSPDGTVLIDRAGVRVLDDATGLHCRCSCDDPGGACVCTGWWQATYDCDAHAWNVVSLLPGAVDGMCLTPAQATAMGIMIQGWTVTANPCVYRKGTAGAPCTCADTCTPADPGTPATTAPFIAGAPTGCCPAPCTCPSGLSDTYTIHFNYLIETFLVATGHTGCTGTPDSQCPSSAPIPGTGTAVVSRSDTNCHWDICYLSGSVPDLCGIDGVTLSQITTPPCGWRVEFDWDAGDDTLDSDSLVGATPDTGIYPNVIHCILVGGGYNRITISNIVVTAGGDCTTGGSAPMGGSARIMAPPITYEPIPYPQWPFMFKAISRWKAKSDIGVGSTITRSLGAYGETFKAVLKRFGIACGCDARAAEYDQKYPYPSN